MSTVEPLGDVNGDGVPDLALVWEDDRYPPDFDDRLGEVHVHLGPLSADLTLASADIVRLHGLRLAYGS